MYQNNQNQQRPFNPYQNPNQNSYQNPNQNPYQDPNQNLYQNPNQNHYQNPQAPPPPLYPQGLSGGENYMSEEQGNKLGLAGRARKQFVKKVYTLLTLQLLFTSIIGYIGFNSPTFKKMFVNMPATIIISVLLLALSIVIGCCVQTFRKYALPIFITFTILFALLVGIIVGKYKSKVVLLSVGITMVVVIGLTIYACTTDNDITDKGGYLLVFSLILLVFGIVAIFWRNPIVQLIYSCLAALLFGVYLIYDTQLVLGKGKYSYSLDDAYLAAIQLYIDVIELFLNILRIVGSFSN